MTSAAEPAVAIPEFTDAKGLEALLAAGGRQRSSAPSHGGASQAATPPVAVSQPIPDAPEFFKHMVKQLDAQGSMLTSLLTGVDIPAETDKYMDEVAEGMWPIAHIYGGGAEKPSKVMLWIMFALALGGLVGVKVARFKAAKEPKPEAPAPAAPQLVQ